MHFFNAAVDKEVIDDKVCAHALCMYVLASDVMMMSYR